MCVLALSEIIHYSFIGENKTTKKKIQFRSKQKQQQSNNKSTRLSKWKTAKNWLFLMIKSDKWNLFTEFDPFFLYLFVCEWKKMKMIIFKGLAWLLLLLSSMYFKCVKCWQNKMKNVCKVTIGIAVVVFISFYYFFFTSIAWI